MEVGSGWGAGSDTDWDWDSIKVWRGQFRFGRVGEEVKMCARVVEEEARLTED